MLDADSLLDVLVSNIALIGLPGSGKTTVGRKLAGRLHGTFVDSDQYIENIIGCPIREFFDREGELAFRTIESKAIDHLTMGSNRVISTGGGSVLSPINRQYLSTRCTCVYLRSTPEDLFRRLKHDRKRPLLQVADPLAALKQLYEVRDPLYREVADFVINTGRPTVATLLNTILMQLEMAGLVDSPDVKRAPTAELKNSEVGE